MSSLWKEKNYIIPVPYIIAHNIYEYDIQKANANVLYSLKLITKDYYDKLCNMDRMDRQIEIGYLIKYNSWIGDKLSEGITSYRKRLFEENGLEDKDILSIKNDAIFIIDKIPTHTEFGNVKFVLKNTYSTYMNLNVVGNSSTDKLELYFKSDQINDIMSLDIKGISDKKLLLHQDYIINVIADILYYIESGNIADAIIYIMDFYNRYIRRELPVGYYRNFNSLSDYSIIAGNSIYSIMVCPDHMISVLDISYNLNLIRTIYGYIVSLHLK